MKMLALNGTITIHGSQKEARNREIAIYKSQQNIISFDLAKNTTSEPLDMPKGKKNLKDQEEAVPDRKVTIGANLSKAEETKLIETLAKNKDIFARSTSDLKGVSRDIIKHS
jgi:hypothetical protein